MFSATNDSYKGKKGTWLMPESHPSLTILSQDKVYLVKSSKNIPTAATPTWKQPSSTWRRLERFQNFSYLANFNTL